MAMSTFAELQTVSAQTLEKQKAMEYHATKGYIEKVAREIASVAFSGHGNTANPDNAPPLQDSGSGNKLM